MQRMSPCLTQVTITKLFFFFLCFFPGLWVVGWCWPQHSQTPRPVTALQKLWHPPPFSSGHSWCVSWSGFCRSSWKLHCPRSTKEAWPFTTGVCTHSWTCFIALYSFWYQWYSLKKGCETKRKVIFLFQLNLKNYHLMSGCDFRAPALELNL